MSVVPGPLTLNIEALRNEAEAAARRSFGKRPRLRATDVRVTAANEVLVCLRTRDGMVRWATLLEPCSDISLLGILRFEFSELTEEVV